MINQRHRNSVKQVRTYPGADIGSDHNPVIMTLSVKLKQPKKRKMNTQLDMNMLNDTKIRNNYNIAVQNRYQVLMNEGTPQNQDDTEKQWTALKESMTKAAEEVLPKKKRVQKQPWMTEEILEKMEKRKIAKSLDPEKYNQLKKEVERECIKAKDEWWNGKCEEVEELESKHESRAMHKKIKEITGQGFRKRGSNCIKSKDGKMLFDEDEIKTRWEEYVSELYNDDRGDPPEIEHDDGEGDKGSKVRKSIRE